MPFAYYQRLSRKNKRIYDRSDKIASVKLKEPERFYRHVRAVERALASGSRPQTEEKVKRLMRALIKAFDVPPVTLRVLARRPSAQWGELHGLYEPEEGRRWPRITVWMRTAKRKQVVAFRTFLRTVIHELLHHLDYTYYHLEDSFHTEGFYKRESDLAKRLLGERR